MGAALLLLAASGAVATEDGKCSAEPPADGSKADCGCSGDFKGEWYGEFFPGIPKIKYEGPKSTNPLAFRYYNAEEVISGKTMKDWLRFSVAFWHTFRGDGGDPFGSATKRAFRAMHANFEFMDKLGVDLWCFHDRDIAPEGDSLEESNRNLDQVVEVALELQKGTRIRPLWGTAQLFKHPRYMHGAATSPNATVFAYAAAQVKKAMDVTQLLGGQNYVFWGGREGYQSLLNTDMALELDNLARFMRLASEYKKQVGWDATLLLEPKPQEPTKHQYDWDVATTVSFLRKYGLEKEFKINVECNHATLSGHSCEHELETARINGVLGNIDANTGDPQTGWDTDQFLVDPREATLIMLAVIRNGGLGTGGFNFDAKLRRESTALVDLFYGHISGMDALARGLRNAAALLDAGALTKLREERYASWGAKGGIGPKIIAGKVGFDDLEKFALSHPDPADDVGSGSQELAEILLDMHL
ncbi:xylose isomerase [Monoraphidium neglectum]|uniref:Xylose isomerase n=1 Tax=Monoraphidium neglectum TaxID=145388 RepID=A0A0D2MWS2_9CHLO|nr:xylose isomerase [Monoraphidium neglectum]KIZ04907.1 xylose isomerase [Monoraphidium neglectum]|eukprot:XP_013903926.1 xylose isomerase [Monoraphidium neglectum]